MQNAGWRLIWAMKPSRHRYAHSLEVQDVFRHYGRLARTMSKLATVYLILLLPAMVPAPVAADEGEPEDAEATRLILERALEAMDPERRIDALPSLQILLDGRMNLAVRHQGVSPYVASWVSIEERIAIDLKQDRIAYDLHWFNYVHSEQTLREIYDSEGRVAYVDVTNGGGGWSPSIPVPDIRDRYRRLLPHLLLREALSHLDRVEALEGIDSRLHYRTSSNDLLGLYFDAQGRLERVDTAIDMPLMGQVTMAWRYFDYEHCQGLLVPRNMELMLDDKLLKRSAITLQLPAQGVEFVTPEKLGPPPAPAPWQAPVPAGQMKPEVVPIATGVYGVRDLRPGFHVIFVEFEDFVLAVDAPSGWYEMQQLPPLNWSLGDSSRALGDKFVRAIQDTLPNKPIRYLVLTHHHSDHIGGLVPFLHVGATLLAGDNTADLAARVPLDGALTSGIERVKGKYTISDSSMTVELIELPDDNPQAQGFLAVYLPKHELMYLSAFIYPLPRGVFPLKESVPAMEWLVKWLDGSRIAVETMLNVHGTGQVEDWQLEWARESIINKDKH